MPAFDLALLQTAIRQAGVDGWLMYDFRRSNPVAHRVLSIDPHMMFSRRWFYYIPANGEPTAIVSAVESHVLQSLPGQRRVFQTWQHLREQLQETLVNVTTIAMEYSPDNVIPVCSWVDAGTLELVKSLGVIVVSSADLAQRFEAVLTPAQVVSHREAAKRILQAKDQFIDWLRERIATEDATLTEYTAQQHFNEYIHLQGLVFEHAPIVAVNAHAGNPHYEPTEATAVPLRRGDILLIDFTGRLASSDVSIIADYTWMYTLGERTPDAVAALFAIVRQARDRGIDFIRQRIEKGEPVLAYTVDDAVREVIRQHGYAEAFVHRTGHNIGTVVHGNGANLDNLETHDTRQLLPNTCCSMEPGIYLPTMGVRTEVNILVLDHSIEVTGVPAQNEITPIFA